jgi:hypothetical protein
VDFISEHLMSVAREKRQREVVCSALLTVVKRTSSLTTHGHEVHQGCSGAYAHPDLHESGHGCPAAHLVSAAIGYYENNRRHMRYDEYLAAGYPIGSGVAEGACRHVVKDRLEQTVMRWTVNGAQAMLHLRVIYLNGHWNEFVNFRVHTEQTALDRRSAAWRDASYTLINYSRRRLMACQDAFDVS